VTARRWAPAAALAALAGAGVAGWLWLGRPAPDAGILEASGRIEGDQAAIGAKLGGRLVRLGGREGDHVESGALIAELASDALQAELERAEHGLHTAREELGQARVHLRSAQRQAEAAGIAVTLSDQESRARIGEAEAALGVARAEVSRAEADLAQAVKDHARVQELYRRELVAAQQLDQAKTAEAVARAALDSARQQVGRAEESLALTRASRLAVEVRQKEAQTAAEQVREAQAGVTTFEARVETAAAAGRLARANLAESRVVAPFSGTILRKLVEPGQVVAPGTPLVTLVDLTRLYAKVYVPEGELAKVKVGDPARVYTDAFPARPFEAAVAEVSQQAEFTPRDVHVKDERVTQVFAVKLALRSPEGALKPGMPVDARIRWRPEAPWGDPTR